VKRSGGIAGPIAYASSVAAYDDGPDAGSADPSGHPSTHYGVYKFANEGTARVYGADDGIASVGIRPYVVYGVGRDQGMTSSPTFAMLAAAVGRPWTISYSGVSHLQLASDTAAAFIAAARSPYAGAGVFNLGGAVVDMTAVVAAIEAAVPAAAGTIGIDGPALPFPGEVVAEAFAREVAAVPSASLQDGVAATVERFRSLAASGALDLARLLG
jgi:nucleoside-diphosphate-sugar epimerase